MKGNSIEQKRKSYTAICLIVIVWICAIFTAGCGTKITADISDYGDTKITVKGLTEEDIVITPNELAELECVEETATGKYEKAGTVTATGPTLNTFLEQYDCTQSDFEQIIFTASDHYTTVLERDFLEANETIIMSVASGDEALGKTEKPMRLLIPGADSDQWTKMVTEIEFKK